MQQQLSEIRMSDGTVISYTVFDGVGPAVVILHGLAGSSREFIPTAEALPGCKVLLIDQRGHGRSTRVPADTSRAAFVADVARVIEAESSEPVDLVGQSMGARTAMLVASAHPHLIRKLASVPAFTILPIRSSLTSSSRPNRLRSSAFDPRGESSAPSSYRMVAVGVVPTDVAGSWILT